jgi:hypothetical protein
MRSGARGRVRGRTRRGSPSAGSGELWASAPCLLGSGYGADARRSPLRSRFLMKSASCPTRMARPRRILPPAARGVRALLYCYQPWYALREAMMIKSIPWSSGPRVASDSGRGTTSVWPDDSCRRAGRGRRSYVAVSSFVLPRYLTFLIAIASRRVLILRQRSIDRPASGTELTIDSDVISSQEGRFIGPRKDRRPGDRIHARHRERSCGWESSGPGGQARTERGSRR